MSAEIQLEPLTLDAAERMFRWISDPAVRLNMGVRAEPSLEFTRRWIRDSQADTSVRARGITVGGAHVGNVVLDRIDRLIGTARLSVYIGETDMRQRGIGTAGIRLAIRQGFAELPLQKIWLVVVMHNVAAVRAYSRVGFRIEGTLRREFWFGGELQDCHYMGLLREEFIDG